MIRRSIRSLFQRITSERFSRPCRRRSIQRSGSAIANMSVEQLEERTLLTDFAASLPIELPANDPNFHLTLRGAITQANNNPGMDRVLLLPGLTYAIGSQLVISDDVLVESTAAGVLGASASTITASNRNHRVLDITNGNSTKINVEIHGVTVTGGGDGSTDLLGAGISNFENLTLRAVHVTGNDSAELDGGGLMQWEGTLNIINSTFSGNSARQGGGMWIQGPDTVQIINSTFSGNSASNNGGGILPLSTTIIRNSTFTGNRADDDGDGNGVGGGISTSPNITTLHNTIVAGNFKGTGADPHDIAGNLVAASTYNLIGDASTAGGLKNGSVGEGTANIVGFFGTGTLSIDSVLDTTLSNNGGLTLTHALVPFSSAIDAGNNAEAVDETGSPLTTDQRVFPDVLYPRIRNGNLDADATVDIGAYETFLDQNSFHVSTDTDVVDDDYSHGNLSLREAINLANMTEHETTIYFDSSLNGRTITLDGSELRVTRPIEILGPGADKLTINANGGSRVLRISDTTATVSGLSVTGGDATQSTNIDPDWDGLGGGIINERGNLTLRDVRVHNNTATYGGGVNNWRGYLHVQNTTLDHNTATGSNGGGLYNWGDGGWATAFLYNTTISSNNGNGIYNWRGSGTAEIIAGHTTIALNSSYGVFNDNGEATFANSLIVGNSDGNIVFTPLTAASTNNITDGVAADLIDTTLQLNGGTTPTHALIPGSAAIDAGQDMAMAIPGLFNTGQSITGGLLGENSPDPHYQLANQPTSGLTAQTAAPNGAWVANDDNSQWISVSDDTIGPNGNYTYQTIFDLTGFDPETAAVTGSWASDDQGTNITLEVSPTGQTNNGYSSLTSFQLNEGFRSGRNTLYFQVPNTSSSPNPTGLRVDDVSGTAKLRSDQRGLSRILNGSGTGNVLPDIGAVEAVFSGPLIVSTTADENDGNYAAGELSLREAIDIANIRPGADEITFSTPAQQPINLSLGQLTITDDVTITGSTFGLTTIDGQQSSRIFNINFAANAVTLQNLSIRNGKTTEDFVHGGGIRSQAGHLTINNSFITDNSTAGTKAGGGGIAVLSGSATITNSTISNNSVVGEESDGGGIYSNTDLTDQTLTITNSTISGNTATQSGGGLYNFDGLTAILGSTITNNTALEGNGSGIASYGDTATRTELFSTIVSGNVNSDVDVLPNSTNSFVSKNYNLIGTGNAVSAFDGDHDQTGITNPGLEPLLRTEFADMPVHALRWESPAFNTGPATSTELPTDQNGISRPRGSAVDIGAFEIELTNSVQGAVYEDVDLNGFQSDGDVSLADLTVQLWFDGGDGLKDFGLAGGDDLFWGATQTDTNGAYEFQELPGGTIHVRAAEPGRFRAFDVNSQSVLVTGPTSNVTLQSFTGPSSSEIRTQYAIGGAEASSLRVASGDINGDGIADIITAAGPGGTPNVRVTDGTTGQQLTDFFAFDEAFTGGVFVGAGDIDGDGKEDIITGADAGAAPHVKVFSGADASGGTLLANFFAFDAGFQGGVRIAAGDVNGDGTADIITGTGPGGGSQVKVFSGTDFSELLSFSAFSSAFTGGIFVAAGDLNSDGNSDIVVSTDAGGSPLVSVFDGTNATLLGSFFAYTPTFTGGARVATGDVNEDGVPDIITGSGGGGGPHVRVFDGTDLAGQTILRDFFAYDASFTDGVFVAGSTEPNFKLSDHAFTITTRTSVFGLDVRLSLPGDLGDAPDIFTGTASGDYQTRLSDNGPMHQIDKRIYLGATVDADSGILQDVPALADDTTGSPDDEDGVVDLTDLILSEGQAPSVTLTATNVTGSAARLYGWIDYNGDGTFDNATERAEAEVPADTTDGSVTLTFPKVPAGAAAATYARFRLSTDDAAQNSTGRAADGEVEDYTVTIQSGRKPGDVDGDDDFDANDSFLIHLIKLSGSDNQIDASKGSSNLSAAEIRSHIEALGLAGDVDGDGDFDANDTFLIHLIKLSGSDSQIDASKGSSSLTATQIRANVDSLSGSSQRSIGTAVQPTPQPKPVVAQLPTKKTSRPLFESSQLNTAQTPISETDALNSTDTVYEGFRSWIDAI